jgi:hypothetical protein
VREAIQDFELPVVLDRRGALRLAMTKKPTLASCLV